MSQARRWEGEGAGGGRRGLKGGGKGRAQGEDAGPWGFRSRGSKAVVEEQQEMR